MKFDFCRKKRRRKVFKKHLGKPESQEGVIPERKKPFYFEQERILGDLSKKELERKLNEMLEEGKEYGDVFIKIDCNIHILRREVPCNKNDYYVRIVEDKDYLSNEKIIRNLIESGKVSSEDRLVDIVFWKRYRVLLFRK